VAIVLLTGDLTVISRVEGAAKKWGQPLHAVSSAAQAVLCCSTETPQLLIIDLATMSIDLKRLVETLRELSSVSMPRIVAFGPHVHEEKLAAAWEAGCDEVVSRGQFFSQLDGLLSRFLAE
jgi:DNA-binding response OmpR family regulator